MSLSLRGEGSGEDRREDYDFTLIVKVAWGIADTSTVTTAGTASACNAPLIIPQGNVTYNDATSFPPSDC